MGKKGKAFTPPGLEYIAGNITTKQNLLGAPKEAGAKWAKGLDLPKKAETIFFAGCGYQYTAGLESMMSLIRKLEKSPIGAELPIGLASFPKKMGVDLAGVYRKLSVKVNDSDGGPLRDAVSVLKHLGLEFGYLAEDEPCCGGLLHWIGWQEEFEDHAREMYQKLKLFGVKRIISIVPSCTYTLRRLTSSSIDGFDIEVKHFLEVVLENIRHTQLRFPRETKVVYHDPCQLARYLGLVAQPRQILRAIRGIELVSTEHTDGEWATCCGGGGGFEVVFPELSQMLAVNRVRELVETGAEIIITHCPGCNMQLKSGLRELGAHDVEVLDLAQVLAMSMVN